MNGLIIPYPGGLGDLFRNELLVRGIKEKYPGINITMLTSREGLLKNIPSLSFSRILSYRFDLIVNLQIDHDFNFLQEKKYLWKELIGITDKTVATNQSAFDNFCSYKDFYQPFELLYKLREKINKNLATWLCEICDIFPIDKRLHYYPTEEELKYADSFTEGFILIHPKSFGVMGPPFENSVEKRNWSIPGFKTFIQQNLNQLNHFRNMVGGFA
jgi:ADP-heptose:LPS heptosyltransferase